MRGTGIHNVSWPSRDKAEKVCLRRKLQPLAVPAREAPPARTAVELDTEERTERSFVPPQRLARPRTAEKAPALAVVSFPARLQLRAPGEVPGPPGPFTGPGNLVLPLDTQDAVKVLVSACAEGKTEIIDGSCLTAWTLPESSRSQDLEPLTARRIDRTLAVEPIELVAERQGGSQEGPIRYGEGFRLRAAGTKALQFVRSAMPFLSKDEFQDWANDDTSNVWQRVNAEGAFRGLCYAAGEAVRNLRFLRGASSTKYGIITDAGNPHIEVAQATTEEEFMDLLLRLNSLTAKDVMLAASSNRKEMLERLIERAKRLDRRGVVSEHQEFLSTEVLEKISRLERTEASLQRELEQAKKALRKKETEQQELQDEFCAFMAQQALEQVSISTKNQDQETSKVTTSTECTPNSSRQSRASASNGFNGVLDAAPAEEKQELNIAVAEVSGASPIREASSFFFPEKSFTARPGMGDNANRETQLDRLASTGSMSFVERVLHGCFHSSAAKAFWQLAMAPYRSSSCNQVELEGKLWEVIVNNRATETLVVGRKIEEMGILEIGFRGTVTEDAYGQTSAANWSSNLDAEAVPLQGPNGASVDLLVHKGCLTCIFSPLFCMSPYWTLFSKSIDLTDDYSPQAPGDAIN
eukprot:symbB.v1.2.035049.t1/scaffold4640.1/size37052/5